MARGDPETAHADDHHQRERELADERRERDHDEGGHHPDRDADPQPTLDPTAVVDVPEEARAYGFSQQFRHFVTAFEQGVEPDETFEDGYIVNCILDACYRSMKSGVWEPVIS
jgi:predicted dehydrogenase